MTISPIFCDVKVIRLNRARRSASESPNRPSSTNGALSAPTMCARRLVQLARHNRGLSRALHGVQRGRLGEEGYLLVVPVDEDMTRRRNDAGGMPPYGEEMVFQFWTREGERRTLRRCPVLSASVVKNSSVEENVGRSYIFIDFGLRPCKDLLDR
jgi:hypothetical protein